MACGAEAAEPDDCVSLSVPDDDMPKVETLIQADEAVDLATIHNDSTGRTRTLAGGGYLRERQLLKNAPSRLAALGALPSELARGARY